MPNLYFFFYFYVLNICWAAQYQIFISNQASPPYNGTALNPFSTLYSAFDYVVAQYNSSVSSADKFYFILIPDIASEPFYLTDAEISNDQLFKGFLGQIYIQSMNANVIPIIEWQTNNFAFHISTLLMISGVSIDGSSVHVKDRSQCQNKMCCTNVSFVDNGSICALQQQYFIRNSSKVIYEGIFILDGVNPTLTIFGVNLTNFYAVLNYNSLISDNRQTANIMIQYFQVTSAFFAQGVFYMDYKNQQNFVSLTVNILNSSFVQWNYYQTEIDLSKNDAFGSVQKFVFLFGLKNVSLFYVQNIFLSENIVDFGFICYSSIIQIDAFYAQNLKASLFHIDNTILNLNEMYVDNLNYKDILTPSLLNGVNKATIILNNLKLSNLHIVYTFWFANSFVEINNITISKLDSIPISNLQDFGSFLHTSSINNNIVIANLEFKNMSSIQTNLISETVLQTKFLIQNASFENLYFLGRGFKFVIMWTNLTIENAVFKNINCSQALFFLSFFIPGQKSCLILKSVIFINIQGGSAPINFLLTGNTKIIVEDSFFYGIQVGISLFFFSTFENVDYVIKNTSFTNLFLFMGFVFTLPPNQSLYIDRSSFDNILLFSPTLYRGLILSTYSYIHINSTIFSKITVYEGDALLFGGVITNYFFENCQISSIIIEGKGGVQLSESNLTFISTNFSSINIAKYGFLFMVNMTIVKIQDCVFSDMVALMNTVINLENVVSLDVSGCIFKNNIARFQNAVFWISSSNLGSEYSFINFKNNVFENNIAKTSFGGGLTFQDCQIPIILVANRFINAQADSGACIYVRNIINLQIIECSFENSLVVSKGGSLYLDNSAETTILASNFSNNFVTNGQGANIYLYNSNLVIEDCIFNRDLVQQAYMIGSGIYAFYEKNNFICKIKTTNFSNLKQEKNVIYLESKLVTSISFEDINFTNIISKNGQGALELLNCIGNITQISIINSTLEKTGVMIKIDNSGIIYYLNQIILGSLWLNSNNLVSQGSHIIMLTEIDKIEINVAICENNYLFDNFWVIENFINCSMTNVKFINDVFQDSSLISMYFLYIHSGDIFFIDGLNIENSIGNLLSISEVNSIFINDFNVSKHKAAIGSSFFLIATNNLFNFSYWNLGFSNLSIFEISSKNVYAQNIYFEGNNFTMIDQTQPFFLFLRGALGDMIIESMKLIKMAYGIYFENYNNIIISNFSFDNSLFRDISYSSLMLYFCERIILKNLELQQVNEISNIIIRNDDTNYIKTINFSNIMLNFSSINTSPTKHKINITGNYYINIESIKILESNSATDLKVFSYYTSIGSNSSIIIKNSTFPAKTQAYIFVPNSTFYLDYKETNAQFLQESNFDVFSYTCRVEVSYLINNIETNISEQNPAKLDSGEKIDLYLKAYDHFNHPTDSFDFVVVELINPSSNESVNINLTNQKAIFSKSQATLLSFSIIEDEKNDSEISLLAKFSGMNKTNLLPKNSDFNFFIPFSITKCSTGHYYENNICYQCQEQTYSLDPEPNSETICHPCPSNAKCYEGKTIVPKPGFWNQNENDPNIFTCERTDACNITCNEGYFGYVCLECLEDYGKKLTRKCEKCEDSLIQMYIIRSTLKWFFLALLTYAQYYLLKYVKGTGYQLCYIVINVFVYHCNIISLSQRFQIDFSEDVEAFYEVQSFFSYLENNLYMVYCIFPRKRDSSFYLIIYAYLCFLLLFEAFFLILVRTFHNYLNKSKLKQSFKVILTEMLPLLIKNNMINYFFYFLGLVFYYDASQINSIFFSQLEMSSDSFLLLLFLFLLLGLIYSIPAFYLFKEVKKHGFYVLDCEYKKKNKIFKALQFVVLFFAIILSHYSAIQYSIAIFIRNLFLLFLGIIVAFRPFESEIVYIIKALSLIAIVISFYEKSNLIIFVNSLFYAVLVGIFIKYSFFHKSGEERKSK